MYAHFLGSHEHAELWPDLTLLARVVDGMDDITVGRHPVLGVCVVSHRGLESLFSWMTHDPIPDELVDCPSSDTERYRAADRAPGLEALLCAIVGRR